jgi:hypothetical protein
MWITYPQALHQFGAWWRIFPAPSVALLPAKKAFKIKHLAQLFALQKAL